jgi:hypothetical protein
MLRLIFKTAEFVAVCAHIVGLVGTHSIRKFAASLASLFGKSSSDIETRGRWKGADGKDIVRSAYITPEQPFVDASVASTLCNGSPVAYVVRPECAQFVTDAWLCDKIVPHLYHFFGRTTESCVLVLGRALLYAAMDDNFEDRMQHDQRERIRAEVARICPAGLLVNPIKRVRLFVWRKDHTLMITEIQDPGPPGCGGNDDGGTNGGGDVGGFAGGAHTGAGAGAGRCPDVSYEIYQELLARQSISDAKHERAFAALRTFLMEHFIKQDGKSDVINDNLKR